METAAQGIRNRPPSYDLFGDRYDNFGETGIGVYVYDREHMESLGIF